MTTYSVLVAKKISTKSCVFCQQLNFGVGEHVLPGWFIREKRHEGPFTATVAGEPYRNRDGNVVRHQSLQGVHVPACESCNSDLNRALEEPAKPIVLKIDAHQDAQTSLVLSAKESEDLARWLLKVGILSNHPDAEHDDPHRESDEGRGVFDDVPAEWIDWMPNAAPPPDHFSVYLTRRTLKGEMAEPTIRQSIVIPKPIVDDKPLNYMARSFGMAGMDVTIVWHPGWEITHPQVDEGRAVRLWPSPSSFDFGALPIVHPRELVFSEVAFGPLRLSSANFKPATAVPLSVDSDPLQRLLHLFGNEDVAPEAGPA